jgi:hypothetical protein
MASTLPIDEKPAPVEPASLDPVARRSTTSTTIVWAVIACLLLGSSAVVRLIQDRRHYEEANFHEDCPFPLKQIPRTLGQWKNTTDDQKLDSQTMRITGSTEHLIRTYSDESTGVRLVVLILFGPVEPVIPHTPDVCYPANGFRKVDEPISRKIKLFKDSSTKEEGDTAVNFRSAVYQKLRLLEGVYHSFRYNGVWTPDLSLGQKFPRRNPGVFKIQIQRVMIPGESRDFEKYPDPIEDFIKYLIPEIEKEISKAAAKDAPKAVVAK